MLSLRTLIAASLLTTRRLLAWSLAIGAMGIPLVYQQSLERKNAASFDLPTENRAAVAMNDWELAGRLNVVAIDDRRILTLRVSRSDWDLLNPDDRQALERRLARAVIRGIPVEEYVIRDEADRVIENGRGRFFAR